MSSRLRQAEITKKEKDYRKRKIKERKRKRQGMRKIKKGCHEDSPILNMYTAATTAAVCVTKISKIFK